MLLRVSSVDEEGTYPTGACNCNYGILIGNHPITHRIPLGRRGDGRSGYEQAGAMSIIEDVGIQARRQFSKLVVYRGETRLCSLCQ